jgi:hypothetical protein
MPAGMGLYAYFFQDNQPLVRTARFMLNQRLFTPKCRELYFAIITQSP